MRIDAHQHFWLPDQIEVEWMKALTGEAARRLVRPALPAELEPILAHHDIQQSVLVQVATHDAEADFLLELAQRHAFIAGAVVWLDMDRADFEVQLSKRAAHPSFLGVRPMVENIQDPGWMLRPTVLRAFRILEERGICFDFLLKHHQLPAALEVLAACPRLHAVMDHIAKPAIRERVLEPWGTLLARVAEHPNVHCKLSGMITEADHEHWAPGDLGPYIERALRAFGPARCMFGSDWPVCTLAGSYAQVLGALEQQLQRLGLTPAEQRRIFGETAREFYRLPGPAGSHS
jgi:L-fucono-1,5-lactonase